MPMIDRDGVEIHYESRGAGSAMLLSHGYGATSRMWDGQVAEFASRHRVITWDMRGHGQSGDPADPALYAHALTVGDMAAVLDACGVERAVIGGLSLGGVMSLAFHIAHPDRVRALVLCDTGPGFRNPDARAAGNDPARAQDRGKGSRRCAAATRRGGTHRSARPGLAPRAACWRHSTQPDPVAADPGTDADHRWVQDKNFGAADYMAKIPGARKV